MPRRRRPPRPSPALGQVPTPMPQQPPSPPPPPPTMPRELLTPKELAERLRVAPITIRRMLKAKKLPYVQVGERRVRFDINDVMQSLPKFKPGSGNDD